VHAVALVRLTDVQAPLNFPDLRRDRLHDRNAEVLLVCAPVRPGAQQ
jgi:hypothetical protein